MKTSILAPVFLSLSFVCTLAHGESLTDISTFAKEMCDKIRTEGKITRTEIEAKLDGEMEGVAKLLGVSVGADGKFRRDKTEYVGLPYDKLSIEMSSARECRKELAAMLINERKTIHSLQKPISIVGSWAGSPDCTVVFYKDDGNEVEGDCDNTGYKHHIKGRYVATDNIRITNVRTDPNNCKTSVQGYIKINTENSLTYGQNGWNGCGVTTGSGTQSWSRM